MSATRVAAIDCGTNSIRLLIADTEGDSKTDLLRETRLVRLGQDVDRDGRLAPDAIERTIVACEEFAQMIDAWQVAVISFAATSAARDASNADEFSDAVHKVLGVRPQVLSGEEEAQASFRGATGELGDGVSLVFDIGGGSTEIVQGTEAPTFIRSLDVGAVRMTERFLASDPPTVPQIGDCIEELDRLLAPVLSSLTESQTVILVAGTATTIAAHALRLDGYDSAQIHGARIDVAEMQAACTALVSMSVADRRLLPYMHPGRADVIGGGALVVDRLLEHVRSQKRQVIISERDILDGLALAAALQS